jgi:hypothetical protein
MLKHQDKNSTRFEWGKNHPAVFSILHGYYKRSSFNISLDYHSQDEWNGFEFDFCFVIYGYGLGFNCVLSK